MILAGARLYVPAVVLNLILKISSKAAKDAQQQNQRRLMIVTPPMTIRWKTIITLMSW